jgi:hypothetical protein
MELFMEDNGNPTTAAGAASSTALGMLDKLVRRWVGNGFNLIARPAGEGRPSGSGPAFKLELNATRETLEFNPLGDIADRGEGEPTVFLRAANYLQTVIDCATQGLIHKEPGLWVHVPKTKENSSETFIRLAATPHGDCLLAQSTSFKTVPGGPRIEPVNSLPFPITNGISDIPDLNADPSNVLGGQYIDPYVHSPVPTECLAKGLDAAPIIKDPTEVLREAIQGRIITETDVIEISTRPPGGILNIPFVTRNANAVQMDAIIWIETVKGGGSGETCYQLQYVQRVILDFDNVHWPHLSVGTLTESR